MCYICTKLSSCGTEPCISGSQIVKYLHISTMVRFFHKFLKRIKGSHEVNPKCIDCKNHGDRRIFKQEEIDQIGIQDLHVCIRCLVPCGSCNRPISKNMSLEDRFCSICSIRLPAHAKSEPVQPPVFRRDSNNSSMFLSASGIGTCSYLCGS